MIFDIGIHCVEIEIDLESSFTLHNEYIHEKNFKPENVFHKVIETTVLLIIKYITSSSLLANGNY